MTPASPRDCSVECALPATGRGNTFLQSFLHLTLATNGSGACTQTREMRSPPMTTSPPRGFVWGAPGQRTLFHARAAAMPCWAHRVFTRCSVRAARARKGTMPSEMSSLPLRLHLTPPLKRSQQDSSLHIQGCDPQTFLLARPAFRGASLPWMLESAVLLPLVLELTAWNQCGRERLPALSPSLVSLNAAASSTGP